MTDNNAVVDATSTKIEIFNNSQFGNIRVQKDENGEPLFCLADVCKALELTNPTHTANQVCEEFGCPTLNVAHLTDSLGRIQEANFITEQQLYFVMNRSDKPNAKPFRMWVNTEVLPSIRKTGSYSITRNPIDVIVTDEDPIARLEAAKQLILEERAKQEAKRKLVEERAEKAETTVKLLTHTRKTYTVTELAKEMGFKSAIAFNKWLADIKFQFKQNGTWLTYSYYSDNDYVSIKQEQLDNGHVIYNRRFTDKGREFLIALHKDK